MAYCRSEGAESHLDREFGVEVKWDIPLFEGYPGSPLKSVLVSWIGIFFGLFNPGIWSLIRGEKFDSVVLYTGYVYATFWIAMAAARMNGAAVLFGTDAHVLSSRNNRGWKLAIKETAMATVVSAGRCRNPAVERWVRIDAITGNLGRAPGNDSLLCR